MTEKKFGWRREQSSAAPMAPKKTNIYAQARPAALSAMPDKWTDIRNIADVRKKNPSRWVAKPKT